MEGSSSVRNRVEPRVRKRLPCSVQVTGRRHTGMVLNVSPRGLFVQTSAEADPGETVDVDLRTPTHRQPIPVQGRVIWRRTVPQRLRNVTKGGLGVRIENASESYYQYLSSVIPARP
jgi:hypothetical protein